jgi:hypothetical protein
MSVVVVISQHLLNVFVPLANKRGLKTNPMRACHFLNLPNLSSLTMTPGFTQSLSEMSTIRCFCVKVRPVRNADSPTAISEPIV